MFSPFSRFQEPEREAIVRQSRQIEKGLASCGGDRWARFPRGVDRCPGTRETLDQFERRRRRRHRYDAYALRTSLHLGHLQCLFQVSWALHAA